MDNYSRARVLYLRSNIRARRYFANRGVSNSRRSVIRTYRYSNAGRLAAAQARVLGRRRLLSRITRDRIHGRYVPHIIRRIANYAYRR